MAYATTQDVARAAGGTDKLRQLTDLEGTGAIDEPYVERTIAESDSVINSYLEKRYAVPLADDDISEVIRNTSAQEAVYILREHREALTPEQQDRHIERMDWLRGVSEGKISPGIDPRSASSDHVRPQFGTRGETTRALTRVKFDGWT